MGCAQGKVEDASRYDHPGHGAHHHGSANHGHHNSSNHGHHGDDHMTWHEVPGAVKEYEEKQKHKHDNHHNSSNHGHPDRRRGSNDVHIDHAHIVNRDIAQKLLHDLHTSNHKGYDAADSLKHHNHHDNHSGSHRRDNHSGAHHDNHSGKHHDTHDNHDANDKDEVVHPVDNSNIKSPTFFGGHPNQRRGSQSHAEEEGEEHQIYNVHHNRNEVHVRHHDENDHNKLHQSLNKDLTEQDLEDYIRKHGMPTGGKHRSRHSHMHAHV